MEYSTTDQDPTFAGVKRMRFESEHESGGLGEKSWKTFCGGCASYTLPLPSYLVGDKILRSWSDRKSPAGIVGNVVKSDDGRVVENSCRRYRSGGRLLSRI